MGSIARNKQFLTDLFSGPFPGHALISEPCRGLPDWSEYDIITSKRSLDYWTSKLESEYEIDLKWHEEVGDDIVPYARLTTGTEFFAAAFGCPIHEYGDHLPCALPLVRTPEEADALSIPDLSTWPIDKIFEIGKLVQERLGPDVPIGVPDIQSPFDIAALIWRKEDMLAAMYEAPDAVKRLTEKCNILLKSFLKEFIREFPNSNLCHCPRAWAPPELGCWLSEDEAGCVSAPMFKEFCLPSLIDLSDTFGGLFMHCCADADHQYGNFRAIPNFRGLNRNFQEAGPRPAVEAFSGQTVLMLWGDEKGLNDLLDMALPDTRYLLHFQSPTLDEAKAVYGRLRERCPSSI
ncbi:MAG: uroporphyrinogen decarboxylase family protein [Armatimonadota bacterium]